MRWRCWSFPRSASASRPPLRPSTARRSPRALEPSPDPDEVARRQALTAEAIALLDESLEPPLDGISDVREQAAHAALGGALSPQALRRVSDTATGSLRARAALDEAAAPLLRELAAAVDPALANAGRGDRPRRRGGRLRPARQRLAEAPQAARRAPDRAAARARRARAARPLERAPRAPAGGVRHAARRPAGARRQGERPPERARASSTTRPTRARRSSSSRSTSSSSTTASRRRRARSGRRSSGSCASSRPPSASAAAASSPPRSRRRGRSTWRSRSAPSRAAGAARPSRSPTRCGWSAARHPLLDPTLGGADRPRPRRRCARS